MYNARIFPGRRQNCVREGSVSIAYIMQSFHKFIVSLFCRIPPPIRAALCKLLVEALLSVELRKTNQGLATRPTSPLEFAGEDGAAMVISFPW